MIVPPVIDVSVPGVPATQGACIASPCAKSSTYCLVAASVDAVGSAKSLIRFELTDTPPDPVGTSVTG